MVVRSVHHVSKSWDDPPSSTSIRLKMPKGRASELRSTPSLKSSGISGIVRITALGLGKIGGGGGILLRLFRS